MKANKAITIALAGVITACAIPFGTVFAAAEYTPDYPVETTDSTGEVKQPFEKNLADEIESISDYAIYGDNFAYTSGLTITILARDDSGDRKCLPNYTHSSTVEKLDYDAKGELYFQDSLNKSYKLNVSPEFKFSNVDAPEHEFQNIDCSMPIIIDTGYYTLNSTNGDLQYWKSGAPTSLGEGFSLIKKYGEYVYAIKDSKVPYEIDEQKATPLDLSYTNFEAAKNILCSDAAKKLAMGNEQLTTANIGRGTYYTQIDADNIGTGETDTFKPKFSEGSTKKAEGDKPCLVLCKSGNTAVIATNDGMFITSTANLKKESNYSAPPNTWSGTDNKAYAIEDTGIYSYPFMSETTRIAVLKSGSENVVTVTDIVSLNFIDTDFYKVTYETTDKDGNNVTFKGYVAANMLTVYDFKAEDKEPHENGDKNYSYDTNVVSVVLAIVIVALVIIAVLYISLVSSKNKPKDRKKKKQKSEEVQDYEEDE